MLTKVTSLVSEADITVENRTDIYIDLNQIVRLVNFCCQQMGLPIGIVIDVTFVDESITTDLHVRHMGLPGPTDVLSFPAMDVRGGPVDPKSLQDEPTLGDIVICPAFIVSNAQSQPTQMNIDACVIHAMLHLIGHDHHVEVGTEFMVSQEAVLTELWKSEQARQGV